MLIAWHAGIETKHQLHLSVPGQPVLSLEKKMISLHGSWVIERPDGTKLATCKPSLSPISSSGCALLHLSVSETALQLL